MAFPSSSRRSRHGGSCFSLKGCRRYCSRSPSTSFFLPRRSYPNVRPRILSRVLTDPGADLKKEERAIVIKRLVDTGYNRAHKFDRSALKRCFSTRTTYLNGIIYLSINLTLGSVSGFLPTIIQTLGYTASRAQLFTVPPYAVAFVGTVAISYLSDRLQSRGIFVVGLMLFSAVGFAILLAVPHNHPVRYFGVFPAVLGCFCNGPLMLSWASNTAGSHSAAAVRLGFMNGFGQCFSSELPGTGHLEH
jgi:Na+/melibiose symporter-like transporter